MKLEEILENAKEREINREEALYLFRETRKCDKALQLFQVASEVRDKEVGTIIKISIGWLGPIIPSCTLNPPCKYCAQSSKTSKNVFTQERALTLEEISVGATLLEETGIRFVWLSGGTTINRDATEVVDAVKAIKSASKLDVHTIDFGQSFSEVTLIEFKNLGVKQVGSAFETTNERLFREVKPGDSLETKKKFAEAIDNRGLGLCTTLMVGLGGSYEDYVDQMFYLKKIENFRCLKVQRFYPIPGTPLENRPPATPIETARTAAIARLIFRDKDIQMDGFTVNSQVSLLAGVNQIRSASVYRARRESEMVRYSYGSKIKKINNLELSNSLPLITKCVIEVGMEVE